MNFSTFLRHLREGFRSVFRNGWMSVASITSIIVSLLILGVFILLVYNVNQLTDKADSQVEINVFLELNVSQSLREQLQSEISKMPEVSNITYIPKNEGLKELRQNLGEGGENFLEGYAENNNPLPDALRVQVVEASTVPFVAQKIEALNNEHVEKPILKVRYGGETIETLFKVTDLIRNIGLVLVAALALMAMFLIANTIRVTILARRREISIMKLVGATNQFIRWPFFIEGALLGGIGALVTIAILFVGYQQLVHAAQSSLSLGTLITLVPLQKVWVWLGGLLLVLGVLIGIWGSTVSIRRFLKV
ncbi:permease-like cell division protein FtsX [Paenibacillus hunanensis]|uniref:permease-like cell division protein FtsX n=1 Tax=Paenibacillus hunanensis TaxID=539262 RepID=UPI0020272B90|nr:permease-like cell division protein FtsX [Paenibacillus hunanensis]MCL9662809.1 permease-like cell division protein FtsX [Paenibacillus hunanensis]